jgi:hypothetical protein
VSIERVGNDRRRRVEPNLSRELSRRTAILFAARPLRLVMGHDDPTQKTVENWINSSDHRAFCEAKIPCLYFGVEDFENHHKASDDYATMTHGFYVRAVETIVLALREFDSSLDAIARETGRGRD